LRYWYEVWEERLATLRKRGSVAPPKESNTTNKDIVA
jgi:hypothetical protein